VWATDLSAEATCVDDRAALLPMPPKVAIVIGRESDGVGRHEGHPVTPALKTQRVATLPRNPL
jgi:hypothetical protein